MIRKLEWDSQFFKKEIGSIDEDDDKNLFIEILERYDLVQCCCDIKNTGYILKLERIGFHYIDTRIDFLMNIDKTGTREPVIAAEKDCDIIIDIAKEVFIYSRYNNSYFGSNQYKNFYAKWVENAILGQFDDLCIIKKNGNKIVGFITLKYIKNRTIQIGLLGVLKKYQGHGFAAALIEDAKFWAKKMGYDIISVATQGVNLSAQKFYIRQGFLPEKIGLWYYYGRT